MGEYSQKQLKWLRDRWKKCRKELEALIPIIKDNADWCVSEEYMALEKSMPPIPKGMKGVGGDLRDLRGANLTEVDFSGGKLTRTNFSGAGLMRADLSGANLFEADLTDAVLTWADLSETDLGGADLSRANLIGANLSGADLYGADLSGAVLIEANLSGANLSGVNCSGAWMERVEYTTDEISHQLRKNWIPHVLKHIPIVRGRKWKPVGITKFEGVDSTKVQGYRDPILRRYIEDYQFIHAFKERYRWVYWLWKWTSDCGRSLLLWMLWSVVFAGFFSWLYSCHLEWFEQSANLKWFDVLYFSVVTFTTLGFGDVTPHHGNATAQAWIMAEVIIGYIMLGGLISILANKLARRA